jgi:hypothetical protein
VNKLLGGRWRVGFAGCQGAKMRDEECFPAEHAEHAESEEAPDWRTTIKIFQ